MVGESGPELLDRNDTPSRVVGAWGEDEGILTSPRLLLWWHGGSVPSQVFVMGGIMKDMDLL